MNTPTVSAASALVRKSMSDGRVRTSKSDGLTHVVARGPTEHIARSDLALAALVSCAGYTARRGDRGRTTRPREACGRVSPSAHAHDGRASDAGGSRRAAARAFRFLRYRATTAPTKVVAITIGTTAREATSIFTDTAPIASAVLSPPPSSPLFTAGVVVCVVVGLDANVVSASSLVATTRVVLDAGVSVGDAEGAAVCSVGGIVGDAVGDLVGIIVGAAVGALVSAECETFASTIVAAMTVLAHVRAPITALLTYLFHCAQRSEWALKWAAKCSVVQRPHVLGKYRVRRWLT